MEERGETRRKEQGHAERPRLSPVAEKPSNLPTIGRTGDLLKPVTDVILERRATWHFEPDPVPDEYLHAILTLAAQAPSGFNLQPWRFLVLRDAASRERLARVVPDYPVVREAPVVVIAFGMKEEVEHHAEAVVREAARRGIGSLEHVDERVRQMLDDLATVPSDVWVNRNTMIAVTFLMLAAEAYGFNTLALECFDSRALRDEFGAPEEAEVVALVAVGRRAGSERAYPGRFPLEAIVFDERYGAPWQPSDSPLAPKQEQFENE